MEINKYARVQEWTRTCEQSAYVVCAPSWIIKLIIMVMCYSIPYQTSTRTGASKIVEERGCILNN